MSPNIQHDADYQHGFIIHGRTCSAHSRYAGTDKAWWRVVMNVSDTGPVRQVIIAEAKTREEALTIAETKLRRRVRDC